MGFFQGISSMYKLFFCRHKSSSRALPTYPTSPEPTKSRKKTKSLYISILKLLSQAPCLYMCDPSILLFHPPHQILLLLATGSIVFTVDFSQLLVNLDISKDIHFSLPKIIRCNGIVHFLLFYISSRRTKQSAISARN